MSDGVYLVDTDVLSAGVPTKAAPAPGLADWMERNSAHLFLSAITVAEVAGGIAKARREGASRRADRLAAWLATLLQLYSARILPLDVAVACILGDLADRARGAGQAPGLADLAIAARAQRHGLTLMTRNLRHFRGLGVPAHDPFAGLPG